MDDLGPLRSQDRFAKRRQGSMRWWWMQPASNPSPRGKFPSIREKNREFCKFEGVATTCPRTNSRHYGRFSAKFPVRIGPGILLSNREFFLSNREFSNAKTGNGRAHALTSCLSRQGKRLSPAMRGPSLFEEKGGYHSLAGTCQGETERRIPESLITSSAGAGPMRSRALPRWEGALVEARA